MKDLLINNIRIKNYDSFITVKDLRNSYLLEDQTAQVILKVRQEFIDILEGKDNRFVIICGPCSIHDEKVAIEYAQKLLELKKKFEKKFLILMRVYFEKPRTTVGWKGLISDPHLNGSNDINYGLKLARKLLIKIASLGVGTATELLDPIIAAYLGELVSWVAIGARTTESQTHRQMASGLSAPVGYKNGTNGDLLVAINAMKSAKAPHSFLSVDDEGKCSVVHTKGNPYGHIILRGGGGKPNFHLEDIETTEIVLKKNNFNQKIMVDCSHENSYKNYKKQFLVAKDIVAQKKIGNQSIFALMIESNLKASNQKLVHNPKDLEYGVSITDQCIGWKETVEIFNFLDQNF